jgi:hypothetical protein
MHSRTAATWSVFIISYGPMDWSAFRGHAIYWRAEAPYVFTPAAPKNGKTLVSLYLGPREMLLRLPRMRM